MTEEKQSPIRNTYPTLSYAEALTISHVTGSSQPERSRVGDRFTSGSCIDHVKEGSIRRTDGTEVSGHLKEGTYEVSPHDCQRKREWLKKTAGDVKLVEKDGRPSPLSLKLMWEVLLAVFHLHDKGKTHGQLNPQSIIIIEEDSKEKRQKGLNLRAKLRPDSPCLNSWNAGSNIVGWQAPEQRNNPGHLTFSANVYSLGAIFYYCFNGMHPSDGWKTVTKKGSLRMVCFPEADDLTSRSLMEKPKSRPNAMELLNHPLFWNSEKRLSFLRDASEKTCDSNYSNLREEPQNLSVVTGAEWDERIKDKNVISYIMEQKIKPKQRKKTDSDKKQKDEYMYNFHSVRDLVRLIRNMMVHYGELPIDVQQTVGTLHKGFDSYFTCRFPNLLIEVYNAVCKCCKEDEYFDRYFNGDVPAASW